MVGKGPENGRNPDKIGVNFATSMTFAALGPQAVQRGRETVGIAGESGPGLLVLVAVTTSVPDRPIERERRGGLSGGRGEHGAGPVHSAGHRAR